MPSTAMFRLPWTEPERPSIPASGAGHVLALSLGDPWGHAVAACHEWNRAADKPVVSHYDPGAERFVDGPLEGTALGVAASPPPALSEGSDDPPRLPFLAEGATGRIACDDPLAMARALAPELFEDARDLERALSVRRSVLDAVYRLGKLTDQAEYERAHEALGGELARLDEVLARQRFVGGGRLSFADVLLFTFSVRLDPVYYELYKATVGLLADFSALEGHARDLFELPELHSTTDFDAIRRAHYLAEPVLNPRRILPLGGLPDLDAPHFRAEHFQAAPSDEATEEDPEKPRTAGEWVRPRSGERAWIRADGHGRYPAEADRYHLYAPYNCPWSHRALLARAVKGLEEAVGASIVYFRRDPERGWQFNPSVPGCTADLANGKRDIAELYEAIGSTERSVPVLWDTKTGSIVSNESAEILRMFNDAFGDLAERDIDLYPVRYRAEIDRLNAVVYQRINNGAYKAGFARSQGAYERAYRRYFRALDWVEDLLGERGWLAGTDHPTEADLRLFPTVFRHDAVYYSRFKLNERRIGSGPLGRWLGRMLRVPGVAGASNLDHARNGYFGRSGNEIVPAGPIPLGLSPKDFSREIWLNRV